MDKSKATVEAVLTEMLDELLEYGNQDGSILDIEYDEKTETCNVKMSVVIVEDDNYIGFQGY